MIVPLVIVLAVAGAILVRLRHFEEPRTRRAAVVSLYLLGVAAAALAVLVTVPTRATTPIAVTVAIVGLALGALVAWTAADLPRSPAESWARAHGVAVTQANEAFVLRYVTEGHRLRLICGFGGAFALASLSRGLGVTVPMSGWVWLMGGYLVGVVWSEAWLTRLPGGTRRAASLTPRRVSDYLSPRLWVAQMVVALASILCGVLALVIDAPVGVDSMTGQFSQMSVARLRSFTAGIGVGAAALTLGIVWLQRRIVVKPQPEGEPDLIAADDAVRASAVHLLSGTTIGIVLVGIGTQVLALGSLGFLSESVAGLINLAAVADALIVWRYYGHRAWIVPGHRRTGHTAEPIEPVGMGAAR